MTWFSQSNSEEEEGSMTSLRNGADRMRVKFLVCTKRYSKCVHFRVSRRVKILKKYKMTKVLIHGWQNDEYSEMPQTLKRAYLKHKDVNVIIVGWGKYSKTLNYSYSVGVIPKLAKYVARFLMVNLRLNNPELAVHLIGHSLGAHVCGYVGTILKKANFYVYRITGLDPASPLIVDGLSSADAYFVDVIHTCAGTLGIWSPIGDIDFYPNGGMIPQPGCNILFPQCSHSYAWKLFALSIEDGSRYLAVQCESYSDFLFSYCSGSEYMGEETSVLGRGNYYINTK